MRLTLKVTNLICLLLSVVWLSRTPDWEPLLAFFTLFFAYLFQEVKVHKKISDLDGRIEHDKTLFLKYDKIFSEDKILYLLNNNINNNWIKYSDKNLFLEFFYLAKSTEGQFLNKNTNKLFKEFFTNLSNLIDFIGMHFFVRDSGTINHENWILELYPDLKYSTENQQRQIYQKSANELCKLCHMTSDSYKRFRKTIKSSLHI